MLSALVIKDFAIIDRLELFFERGMHVLTGETGAGKSIIIDALNLLLGGRASTEVIRTGCDEALVQGLFEPSGPLAASLEVQLQTLGIPFPEGQFVVRRTITRSGRNKVFINGSLVTVNTLRGLARGLVDISGQHEHYSLMDSGEHIHILDRFATHHTLCQDVAEGYSTLRRMREERDALRAEARARLARIDYLRFQLDELDDASLQVDEERALEEELETLEHAETLQELSFRIEHELYERDGAVNEVIGGLRREVERLAGQTRVFEGVSLQLNHLSEAVADVVHEVRSLAIPDADPVRLDGVQERLDRIERLKRKYGLEVVEILEETEQMREELDRLEHAESRLETWTEEIERVERDLVKRARALSASRRDAATRLQDMIEQELSRLGMPRAQLVVVVDFNEDPATLRTTGLDDVVFLLSPNPGEEPKSLAKIASGGELSRVMLAIKRVLAVNDDVLTYVFDEVDTGIGGAVAEQVARALHQVSLNRQVICITHLATIASYADHHFAVEKRVAEGRTFSHIHPLEDDARVREIARMIGGLHITPRTLAHAAEMVARSGAEDLRHEA